MKGYCRGDGTWVEFWKGVGFSQVKEKNGTNCNALEGASWMNKSKES